LALRAAEAGHESVVDELAAALGDEGDGSGLRIRVARQGGGRAGGCARRVVRDAEGWDEQGPIHVTIKTRASTQRDYANTESRIRC